jgi:hypothetical protein
MPFDVGQFDVVATSLIEKCGNGGDPIRLARMVKLMAG